MPMLAPIMAIGSLATTALGTMASANASLAAGRNAEAMGQYQQAQYLQEADTSVARAQRKMEEQNRKTELVQSQLTARSAGAGLNPATGSTDILAGQIGQRGTYNSLMDLSQGQDIAGGYYNMGAAARYQGDLAEKMAPMQAAGSIAGGAGSMFNTL